MADEYSLRHPRAEGERDNPGDLHPGGQSTSPTRPTALGSRSHITRTGEPLPFDVQAHFQARLGADLSHVRIHRDSQATAAAVSVGARAFTVGADVVFGPDQYCPETPEGRSLLAHELTHVVQQGGGAPGPPGGAGISPASVSLQRATYCDEDGVCWEEDEATGATYVLDHTPEDYTLVPSSTGSAEPEGWSASSSPLTSGGPDVGCDAGGCWETDPTQGVSRALDYTPEQPAPPEAGPAPLPEVPPATRAFCDDAGNCWEEDPVSGETRILDHMPPDAVLVSSETGLPAPLSPNDTEVELAAQEFIARAVLNTAGVQLAASEWPYYYRALAHGRTGVPNDPTLAQIRGGADILPRQPDPGNTFVPEATREDMTFRHTRPSQAGTNVTKKGTNRVSATRRIDPLLTDRFSAQPEIARIDVPGVERSGEQFLRYEAVVADLDKVEQRLLREIAEAEQAGRGKNYIKRLKNRLSGARKALEYVRTYQEGHGVNRIPAGNARAVRYPRLERYGPGAVKGLGWGMLGLSAYLSWDRIQSAPEEKRGDVAGQEAAGFAADLVFPTAGVYAKHAVRTEQEGLQPTSLAFPTPYTWLLEAWVGDTLVEQDPEGAKLVERSYTDPAAAEEFWRRLTGTWVP